MEWNLYNVWGFPKIRGAFLGGSILGYPNFGKLQCRIPIIPMVSI